MPKVQKACILCNGTLSFYTLPELSPAFNNTTVANCTWVGGLDLNNEHDPDENGTVVMICVRNKTRLVRLGDGPRRVKDIEYAGCLMSVRRGNFACVADSRSYALLDIDNQQKITLFPISSLDEDTARGGGRVEDIAPTVTPPRSASKSRPLQSGEGDARGHSRSTSLGALVGGLAKRQESPRPAHSRERSSDMAFEPGLQDLSGAPTGHSRSESSPENTGVLTASTEKPLPPPPRSSSLRPPSINAPPPDPLRPHVCSPAPSEFLLVTGTTSKEAGVGIFVNLDGDIVRGTLSFSRYPSSVALDGKGHSYEGALDQGNTEGFILAIVPPLSDSGEYEALEIQRWDAEEGDKKEFVQVPIKKPLNTGDQNVKFNSSIRNVATTATVNFPEVGSLLRNQRLTEPAQSSELDLAREREELEFGRRLGNNQSNVALWSGSSVWWAVRNPLLMKLEASIETLLPDKSNQHLVDRKGLIRIVSGVRGQEATSETEFLSLEYGRQKIGILLFSDILVRLSRGLEVQSADVKNTEDLLMESALDPRVLLSFLPTFSKEVIEGSKGIWIHAGIIPAVKKCSSMVKDALQDISRPDILAIIKRYLGSWRQRKGFGSISDELEVFQTIDAALLRALLLLENTVARQGVKSSPQRAELHALVDSGVDCFDRAVQILEQDHQLYVLSRLYQSRRNARGVLETWKRIIEGDQDVGGGLPDGENEVRKYLVNTKDHGLVDEYGTWLARRNPALGVQVFTNEKSKVKWEPHQVVMLLRRKAPDSVKDYLEHLVFGKKHVQYANDLISYYLDSVLTILGSSEEAHEMLSQSYETYRALRPPKPTYRQFITDNAVPLSWWHDRLRLLELIGGSYGSGFSYDVGQVLSRIEPFEEDLVPESIILDGRQGRHQQALRLLTHGLGDYHTAVNYCLLGGASIFHPAQGSPDQLSAPSQEEQSKLFSHLLKEFLRIEDASDRIERTSDLLERFSSWYDVGEVLDLIPSSWSVDLVSGFLISSFRRLVQEGTEATVVKALSGAEYLQTESAFIEKCLAVGPQVQTEAEPN